MSPRDTKPLYKPLMWDEAFVMHEIPPPYSAFHPVIMRF